MIILDTNVVSETQRPNPDPNVMKFLERCDPNQTYLTTITVAEILHGIDLLPDGKRKKQLEDSAFKLFEKVFKGRILPFDFDAASHYATNAAEAKTEGKAVSFADGQIAGIALANGGVKVVTRDVAPFDAMNVATINPWN